MNGRNRETGDLGTADTERPAPLVHNADAPCDAAGCKKPWLQRVEWFNDQDEPVVRYACARHAYLYLKCSPNKLPQ